MGGVARRATALAIYRRSERDTAVLALETGNDMRQSDNLDDPANKWIVQALELLNINIMNTTIADLRRLNRLLELDQLPKEMHSLYISSIVEPGPRLKFPVKPYSIQTLKPIEGSEEVHVGVLAISPPGLEQPQAAKLLSPEEAIERYLPKVEAKSDIVILLARMNGDQLVRLARMYPGIDIIINGSSTSEGKEYSKVGNTVIVEASREGESLGALDVEWDTKGHITKFANQLIPLPPMITDSRPLAAIVNQAHAEQARLAEEEARRSPPITIPSVYAGSRECAVCHEKAYRVWEKSKHARAIDALMTTHDQYNQACILCHVTGFGVSRGYADLIRTPWLANVQCEACHGMSAKHVKSPQTEKPGLGFKVTPPSCLRCHTPENSPSFNFENYWPKIKH